MDSSGLADVALARSYVRSAHAALLDDLDSQDAYDTLDKALVEYAKELRKITSRWPADARSLELCEHVIEAEREMGLLGFEEMETEQSKERNRFEG